MKKLIGFASLIGALVLGLALLMPPAGAALNGAFSIVGSTSVQPMAEELAKAFMAANPGVSVTVAGGGSGAGIKAAQNGTADIGTSSRDLTPEEETGLTATVIAKDGIAVIVNKQNRIAALTAEQLAKIYSGQVTNWKYIGGAGAPVILIGREAGSGTRRAFEELVLQPSQLTISNTMMQQGSTGAVRQIVSVTKNAIGYISLGQADKSIKALTIDGVKPSEANVLNKSYKLSRPLLFLTKGAPHGLAKAFIDYVLGPAGQALVAKEFVPIGKTK